MNFIITEIMHGATSGIVPLVTTKYAGQLANELWLGVSSEGRLICALDILQHYFSASGETYRLAFFDAAVASVRAQRWSYYNHMNTFMNMIESTVIPDNTYYFSTNPETNMGVSYHKIINETIVDADWRLAIGGAHNAIVAKVICKEREDGKRIYSAIVNFLVLDYYDWEGEDIHEQYLHMMHEYGMAQSFFVYGQYVTSLEWEEHSRFPQIVIPEGVNIGQLFFSGIKDTSLEAAYKSAMILYKY